jgi:hypothetical protein
VFGDHNLHSEDYGFGSWCVYHLSWWFFFSRPIVCLYVCLLFIPSFLPPSLHQGKFYSTTFRQQQSLLWSFCLRLCLFAVQNVVLTELGKKFGVPYFGVKHSCACRIHLFPLREDMIPGQHMKLHTPVKMILFCAFRILLSCSDCEIVSEMFLVFL